MALTTEQVFALGILYNKLATIVYGEDGPKANNLQNATMYPLMEIAQLILRAHIEHRITPELDRLIALTYSTITEDDMQNEFSKLLPVELQGSFALGYYHDQAEKYSDIKPIGLKAIKLCQFLFTHNGHMYLALQYRVLGIIAVLIQAGHRVQPVKQCCILASKMI